MAAPRILFLDEDHVVNLFRMILANREHQPSFSGWFAPEPIDLEPLTRAATGLRTSEGALVGSLAQEPPPDAEIIIFRRGEITARTLDENPSLRFVQRLGERTDGIDVGALRERGVRLSCLPRRTLNFTAEHALLLMLALGKKLLPADAAVRQEPRALDGRAPASGSVAYNWPGIAGATGLCGSTLGIVGLGEVGSLVARLASAFGMEVLYHKPHRADPRREASLGVTYVTLDELLARSDFVTLHARDVPENRAMAAEAFFRGMKPGACFVNTSRGRLVDEDALYRALSEGRLGGAGLDVHATEPRAGGDRFASLPNVVLTPHMAGGARSGVLDEFQGMAQYCRAATRGGDIQFEV